MAGTFSQIYIQIIFAVKGRQNLIHKDWDDELYQYISGIITQKGQKSIIVNGMPDHIHVFIGLRPSMLISDMARDVKNNSANFINKRQFVAGHFSWQEGYGVFSYSHSQLSSVYAYIRDQKIHHQKTSFKDEYLRLLNKFEVDHDAKYLFEWYD
ncbi:IS200/IS605 family transposase [Danxiaibacter flavus]|uniref:IS200/IS605 family transposase n=1 Tax=Danxiaibacter flavus TaxID=3049108 RepID=A0ABV3ZI73_9BACT|nr:IS200/IS605 family transposase [Chitinophagaceae bacterium DXS]